MLFAVIGDIESNFCNLKAVFNALDKEGVFTVLHTGNVCKRPKDAHECLSLLRDRAVLSVQGKHDKAVARAVKSQTCTGRDAWAATTNAALESADIEYLARLPRVRTVTEEGLGILLCHGAVNSPSTTLSADTSRNIFRRQREIANKDIIICGGAPDPFAIHVDGALFVCPGTLACADGRARYTLVNTETLPWTATHISGVA